MTTPSPARPNILLINCDDLGYGDLGCYGSPVHRTPAIDRLAAEGLKLTSFYMASPVCTPSRGAMMTGSHPRRIGFTDFEGLPVLFPGQGLGLKPGEQTLATMLREAGYVTGMVGKWHCGDQPEFLPTRHGFGFYFGLPYSHDMGRMKHKDGNNRETPLPLILGDDVIEEQPLIEGLTERYTFEAVKFIRENKDQPFFLYLAHLHTHLPHLAAERFMKQSQNGEYGAAVEYLDWSTDVLLRELDRLGLADNTIVIFTSDNGSRVNGEGGSNGPLRGTKRTNWEGGVRLPCLVRWPAAIPAGSVSDEITWSPDFLPTFAAVAGGTLDADRPLDGQDVSPLWREPATAKSPHQAALPYYWKGEMEAVRLGPWKLHLSRHEPAIGAVEELYNLDDDIGETTNVAAEHPDIVARLKEAAQVARERLGDDLTGTPGQGLRPIGRVDNPKPLATYDPSHPYIVALYDGKAG